MNKVFDINIGGKKFVIDDDAYTLLSDYLDTLHHLFLHRFEGEEVADDIELRVSELLSEKLAERSSQIVTSADVTDIIARVGSPTDLASESYAQDDEAEAPDNSSYGQDAEQPEDADSGRSSEEGCAPESRAAGASFAEEGGNCFPPVKKKLFRDPQDSMLGGVCSGLAAYMNTNPIWIRILTVILCFVSFWTVGILYLVLCIVVPEAKTPMERLQMRGEQPTVKNIGDAVTSRYRQNERSGCYDGAGEMPDGQPQPTSNGFTRFFSTLAKIMLVLLLVVLSPVLVGIAIAFAFTAFVLLVGLIGALTNLTSFGWLSDNWWLLNEFGFQGMVLAFCAMIAVGLPLFVLAWGAYTALSKKNSLKPKVLWTLFIVWVLSVAGCFVANKWNKMSRDAGDDRPMIEYFEDELDNLDKEKASIF